MHRKNPGWIAMNMGNTQLNIVAPNKPITERTMIEKKDFPLASFLTTKKPTTDITAVNPSVT